MEDRGKSGDRLSSWQDRSNEPEILKRFIRDLLEARASYRLDASGASKPSQDAIRERLACGRPALTFDDFCLDWEAIADAFNLTVSVFVGYPQLFDVSPISPDVFGVREVERAARERFDGAFRTDRPDISIMMDLTLNPYLANFRRSLDLEIDQTTWLQNYCPICGGTADIAYLEAQRGRQWLVCSRCDMEWVFQRLKCPACGTADQSKLSYFTDDEGLYRLYVCEQCKHYLKTIDMRHAEGELDFAVERLLTLHLDAQAHAAGYHSQSILS